jgi:hypothetical protein
MKESKLLTPHFKNPRSPKEIATPLMAKNDCRSGCFKEYGLQTFAKQKLRGLLKPIKSNILHEIGCLQITFVVEGTNESIDLDKYDQYYHHLFYGMRMQKNR